MITVLHNNKTGNNAAVARIISDRFKCVTVTAEERPDLTPFDTIIVVLSNVGDEEISQPMEDYLFNLAATGKRYFIIELGNYFGFENYGGCKSVAFKLLDKLSWIKLGDISIDSLPILDVAALGRWLDKEFHVISDS